MGKTITYGVKDAAIDLGISKSKMYELARRQDADFVVKLGGRTLISRARLEAWIDRHAGGYDTDS